MLRLVISNVLGIIGAALGGLLGFYTFGWLFGQGWYGLMIPGAFLGFGCSLLARHRSTARGIVCGIAAIGLGLYTEWRFRPFAADDSFQYFLLNVKDLTPVTLIMLVIGTLIAFWVGKDAGFRAYARPGQPPLPRKPPGTAAELSEPVLDHARPSKPPAESALPHEPPP
jgi:hypothetical protein